jgi:hypothetical protein
MLGQTGAVVESSNRPHELVTLQPSFEARQLGHFRRSAATSVTFRNLPNRTQKRTFTTGMIPGRNEIDSENFHVTSTGPRHPADPHNYKNAHFFIPTDFLFLSSLSSFITRSGPWGQDLFKPTSINPHLPLLSSTDIVFLSSLDRVHWVGILSFQTVVDLSSSSTDHLRPSTLFNSTCHRITLSLTIKD